MEEERMYSEETRDGWNRSTAREPSIESVYSLVRSFAWLGGGRGRKGWIGLVARRDQSAPRRRVWLLPILCRRAFSMRIETGRGGGWRDGWMEKLIIVFNLTFSSPDQCVGCELWFPPLVSFYWDWDFFMDIKKFKRGIRRRIALAL